MKSTARAETAHSAPTARRLPGEGKLGKSANAPQAKHSLATAHDKKQKAKRNWLDTFTKLAVAVILINAVGWVWCSYGLAYLGRYEIAETLSQTAVDAILGVFISYAVKSAVENVNKHGVNLAPKPKEKNPGGEAGIGMNMNMNMKRDY